MSFYFMLVFAMLAFAGNSVLCRMALGEGAIDAVSFTCIRLLSGAVLLGLILVSRYRDLFGETRINMLSALMLFIYALCFSLSYVDIATGTGALILFGTVQLSLMAYGLFKGERPGALSWLGMLMAFSGLVYLLMPGVSAPPLSSAMLMMAAGMAWAVYTIRGKSSSYPLVSTGWNFIATLPMILLAFLMFYEHVHVNTRGIVLAILSGAISSALGYVAWYSLLPHLTRIKAATVQLSVPVIAAFGGAIFLSESITLRLLTASAVVLGGVYLTVRASMVTAKKPGT
jgi:drug/metabolite transporter (DMT)-like permease